METSTNQTDATDLIPARLAVAAATAGVMDTGGRYAVPTFTLPSWVWADEPAPNDQLEPMDPQEVRNLMQLDVVHNPLLGDVWRDDINDQLVDSS